MKFGIVTGFFQAPEPFSTVTGTVYFTVSSAALSGPEKAVVLPVPVAVSVSASGFTQSLRATDDPALNPTGFSYLVSFDLKADGRPVKLDSFSIDVPAESVRDLADIAPVPASNGVQIVRGPQGETGPANVLSIGTVTTGNTGTPAAASIKGTAPEQTLDLTLPRGAQGVQGVKGERGSRWYTNGPETVDYFNVVGMIEGDLFLYGASRDLFRYNGIEWTYQGLLGA